MDETNGNFARGLAQDLAGLVALTLFTATLILWLDALAVG